MDDEIPPQTATVEIIPGHQDDSIPPPHSPRQSLSAHTTSTTTETPGDTSTVTAGTHSDESFSQISLEALTASSSSQPQSRSTPLSQPQLPRSEGDSHAQRGATRSASAETVVARALDVQHHPDSSYIESATMDQTKAPEDSLTEEAVREHLKDVESSFLPTLSPIPTGVTNAEGGVDDTYVFDSPTKASQPNRGLGQALAQKMAQGDAAQGVDGGRQSDADLESFDSSPTAAAAARTVSRVVSTTTNAPASGKGGRTSDEQGDTDANADDKDADADAEGTNASFMSSTGDPTLSRSQSLSEKQDFGNTSGTSSRSRRPKYLRSRFGSQRSSASSFATNPESHDGSDVTVNHLGVDYALQSGGAVPAMGNPRSFSGMSRVISMGSVASSGFGVDDFDPTSHPLEPLPEVDSPERPRHRDPMKTPKPSKDNFETNDTVIARHVRNVQVPESLAKEYKFRGGLETPGRPSYYMSSGTLGRTGKNLTLKEQSSTIERLSKENFDLKLKVMFLSDRLDKLSEEGIKEMISENVELKTSFAVLQRDNKLLRRRVKELEKQAKDDDERPSTARSGASSTDQTARLYDEDAQEREEELIFLRERVEEYATEIERLRGESLNKESEKRKLTDIVRSLGERTGENLGRQEEADVWKDLLEQESARREQADDDNRRLRDEIFRMKQEMAGKQSAMHHTTNIYNISKKDRNRNESPSRPVSGMSGDVEGSYTNFSAASTLAEELRREGEQLRHENAELRREVGAQTSMLTSRNREKERLQQEIEDLKMAQRRVGGGAAPSTIDSILERSASRAGAHDRSRSRGSGITRASSAGEDDGRREELENELALARDKVSEVKLQNQELQRELDACMDDFEAAVEGKRQAEDRAMALQEDMDNAMNDLVSLQAERDEVLQDHNALETEFEALRTEAQDEIDLLENEADQRAEESQRLHAELADRSENFNALQDEMRKMSEALVRLEDEQDSKLRRIEQLELELDSSSKELEELESKLLEANDKNQRLSVQQESSQGEIAFLREEQEGDKIRIGDLEAALASAEQTLRDEKDRAKELDGRLQQERRQREMVADKEKGEVQQLFNKLNREASSANDEVRRLRKNLSSREVEAAEWKERLIELENNLREALGDLNGTRSSLLKSIATMQRELENTIRDLDTSKAALVEKDRIIKKRDELLESHALESRKLGDLLDKERVGHRSTKTQFETFQKNHSHLTRTASTQDVRIAELESTRGQDRRKIAVLEQTAREQLMERNQLLLQLWQKLSGLCGKEWTNSNTLIDRQALPTLEVVATRLPGFSKNLLAAVKAIESMLGSFESKIKSVERDLHREYATLENNLEVRTKKLDRIETMVRNAAASGSLGSQDSGSRYARLEDAYRQLKVECQTLRAAADARNRSSYTSTSADALIAASVAGSPSPSIHRGPGDRDKDRFRRASSRGSRSDTLVRASTSAGVPASSSSSGVGSMEVALSDKTSSSNNGAPSGYDKPLLLRLKDMEAKLKLEREGRNQDRQAARHRLSGLESENKDLRDRAKRHE